jgi:hypothetical protein
MPPYSSASSLAFADGFQALVRSVVLDLPTAAQRGSAVYSSACFKHCTTNSGSFYGVRVNSVSLKTALEQWYFASTPASAATGLPAGMPPQRIESCNGFGCGECHAKTAKPAPPLPPAYATSLYAPGSSGGVASDSIATAEAEARRLPAGREARMAMHVGLLALAACVVLACCSRLQSGGAAARDECVAAALRLVARGRLLLTRVCVCAVAQGRVCGVAAA